MRHAQDPLGTPGRNVGDGVGDVRRALDDVVVAVALLVLVPLIAPGWKLFHWTLCSENSQEDGGR